MKYKLAIFDMDGTILNTLEDLKNSLNYSLEACSLPPRTLPEIRRFVGNGIRRLVELGVPDGTNAERTERVFKIFNEHYAMHCSDNTCAYDGIIAAVSELRSHGMLTAVVSNKADYAVQALCEQFFNGLFDIAVGAKDSVRKKPYPDSVNTVLEKLGTDRTQAVYIGDTEVDIATAKNSGTDCITVDWGFRDRAELIADGAGVIVSNTQELVRILVF